MLESSSKTPRFPGDRRSAPIVVDVWIARTDDAGDLRKWYGTLSAEERDRAGKFRRDSDRTSYVVAHSLLRQALTARAGSVSEAEWSFVRQPTGRPVLDARFEPTRLRFSLSHCERAAACIIAEGLDVGIDVEPADRVTPASIVERYFTPSEKAAFAAAASSARNALFIKSWTLKEAYLKARGLGLSEDALAQVGFETDANKSLISATFDPEWRDQPADWHFEAWSDDACQFAVAIRGARAALAIQRRAR